MSHCLRHAAKITNAKGSTKRKSKNRLEAIQPYAGDNRYLRRSRSGKFTKQAQVGRSLSRDKRLKAKRVVPKGQGDRGDQKR